MQISYRDVRAAIGFGAVLVLTGCARESGSVERMAAAAPAEAWETLFSGHDLSGWKPLNPRTSTWQVVGDVKVESDKPDRFVITPGTGILLNSPDGRTCNLVSERSFDDCEVHVEWTVPHGSNSGVYFESRYEVQILDSYGKKEIGVHDAGAIYSQWINEKDVNGHTPRVNIAKAPGEWQTFDVIYRAPRFDADGKKTQNTRFESVLMNGTLIHETIEIFGPTRAGLEGPEVPEAPFLIQGDHGPVAFRSFRVRPLK